MEKSNLSSIILKYWKTYVTPIIVLPPLTSVLITFSIAFSLNLNFSEAIQLSMLLIFNIWALLFTIAIPAISVDVLALESKKQEYEKYLNSMSSKKNTIDTLKPWSLITVMNLGIVFGNINTWILDAQEAISTKIIIINELTNILLILLLISIGAFSIVLIISFILSRIKMKLIRQNANLLTININLTLKNGEASEVNPEDFIGNAEVCSSKE